MPGRPRTKARRLAEIEERLYRLLYDFLDVLPDRRMTESEIDALWERTFHALSGAQMTTEVLLRELQLKAGLPADELQEKRKQRDWEGCTETEATAETAATG